jgi:EmrB/QacA subfamily drug resistance transporter
VARFTLKGMFSRRTLVATAEATSSMGAELLDLNPDAEDGSQVVSQRIEPSILSYDSSARQRKLIFGICATSLFMASIDQTIVAAVLPRIGNAMYSRLNWTGWIVTIYAVGQIIAMPLAGKISDQFGRKQVFLYCIAIFTVSSLACGLATNIYELILFRFVQALGGGGFMPCAAGIIADSFGSNRDRAIGMFSSIFPIGQIAGPVFGGLITEYWIWRGVFFVNVPIGIGLLFLAVRYIPRAATRERSRFDMAGVGLLTMTIISGMLAISSLGENGVSVVDVRFLLPFVAAVVLGWLLMRHEHRTSTPLIPPRLINGKGFRTMNLLNLLFGAALLGFATLAPIYAENRYHIAISEAGTVMSARALGTLIIAAAATMLLRRTGYRLPMTIGFLTTAVAFIMIAVSPWGISAYWWIALFSLLAGLGLGCAAPASNNAVLQLAPHDIGAIIGLRGMFRQIGGIAYVAIATTVIARSTHPGLAQAHIFLIQAFVLVLMVGLVYTVPDHRGSW